MIHELKTWVEFYKEVQAEYKKFEVRKNDRGFAVGDKLVLREYDNQEGEYTGQYSEFKVTYILHGGMFGIEPGYVVMSLE